MAYAEESPVLVIAGAPQAQWREADELFHHRVKSPETQLRVYVEVTVAQASIQSATQAAEEIDRVLASVRRFSRPGFIEIARDAVNMPVLLPPRKGSAAAAENGSRRAAMREAIGEIAAALNSSRRPVVYAGVEIGRFGLMDKLRRFVERVGLPVATSLMGKAVLPENHANFIGNYFGRLGPEPVRRYVESSDCILALGMLMTDMDTGLYTGHLDRRRLIQATSRGTHVGHHFYPDVSLTDLLDALLRQDRLNRHRFTLPRRPAARRPPSAGNMLSMTWPAISTEPTPSHTPGEPGPHSAERSPSSPTTAKSSTKARSKSGRPICSTSDRPATGPPWSASPTTISTAGAVPTPPTCSPRRWRRSPPAGPWDWNRSRARLN